MRLRDIGIRAASTAVLAPAALFALWWGGWPFILMVVVAAALLSLEWGLISAPKAARPVGWAVAAAVVAAVLAASQGAFLLGFCLLGLGALGAALFARAIGARPLDTAYGVLYLGWPCVLMVWLRMADEGGRWTILLFSITWAADIFAYLSGSLMKGPKLWPRFSPAKTWSGFVGGVAAGGVVAMLVVVGFEVAGPKWAITGLNWWAAGLLGVAGALATMAGDLWESGLKRHFGVKDAGSLIPGHGGLLDRVDGLLFSVVLVALARLLVMFGAGA